MSPVLSLIVGCGATGVRVAARAVAAGDRVTGLVRHEASARGVRAVGAGSQVLDLDAHAPNLPRCDRLFYCAPPPREGDIDTRMDTVLAGLGAVPAQVVYISTSGVYGDCGGAWVDEDRPVAPDTNRARRRVDGERRIAAFAPHAVILRAPGIYGPGRLPVTRVREGAPIVDEAEGPWSNRVHIDDLAEIAWRAGSQGPWAHTVYNACDGHPTTLGAYYDALAERLGVAVPPRISWAQAERRFSAMRLSFLRESRRLSNARLLADSGYKPRFADFRDGLDASLAAQSPDSESAP